jgi:hypothetical protein
MQAIAKQANKNRIASSPKDCVALKSQAMLPATPS